MSIVIGGEYRVFASNKKSFFEECTWAKGSFENNDYRSVTQVESYRNGSYLIRPESEDEVEDLMSSEYLEDDEIFEFEAFEGVEFEESYGGCGIDYEFEGFSAEEEEKFLDDLYEWDNFPDDFFRERGYDDVDYRTYIIGSVDIESVGS